MPSLGWWFGFLESPYERDCYLRVPLESQITGPQTNNWPLYSWFIPNPQKRLALDVQVRPLKTIDGKAANSSQKSVASKQSNDPSLPNTLWVNIFGPTNTILRILPGFLSHRFTRYLMVFGRFWNSAREGRCFHFISSPLCGPGAWRVKHACFPPWQSAARSFGLNGCLVNIPWNTGWWMTNLFMSMSNSNPKKV